jgi:hypothetical protein
MPQDSQLEPRVATLESQVQNLVAAVRDMAEHQEDRDRTLFRKIDELQVKTSPNVGNMAAWAGVIVAVIFGVATPVTVGMMSSASRDREEWRRQIESLDLKLQKETALVNGSTDAKISNLREMYLMRHEDLRTEVIARDDAVKTSLAVAITRLDHSDVRQWDQIKTELDELHERRMMDLKQTPKP